MDNKGNIDLSAAFKKLLAENKSQEARLQEYTKIINSRDHEIEMLQTMLSESNAYRSSIDNQLHELSDLKKFIGDLQQQVAGAVYTTTGRQQQLSDTVSVEQQLKNLRLEYTLLQSQLTDLQAQLLDANNRNLLLQLQTSRIAELESLLEIAEQEAVKWKQQATQYKTNIIKGL